VLVKTPHPQHRRPGVPSLFDAFVSLSVSFLPRSLEHLCDPAGCRRLVEGVKAPAMTLWSVGSLPSLCRLHWGRLVPDVLMLDASQCLKLVSRGTLFCCCLFQEKLRVYVRCDTRYTFGAIAILVRLPWGEILWLR
jgi:hypothetical protein